eukprot:s1486_g16.t1
MMGDVRTLGSLRIDISFLGEKLANDHPNTLWFEDSTDEATADNGHNGEDGENTEARAEEMERYGRELMTPEEEASLAGDAELRVVINSLDNEESCSDVGARRASSSSTHAIAVVPITPPNFTDRSRGGAIAKPKANRK